MTSRRSPAGIPKPRSTRKSLSARRACCCRTSPASRASWTSPPCATQWSRWVPIPRRSTRCSLSEIVTRSLGASRLLRHFPDALDKNAQLEFERNGERYAFLKWAQDALANFRAVPPDTGIVHQVNIEFLARVVFGAGGAGERLHAGGSDRISRLRDRAPIRTRRWQTASASSRGASVASKPKPPCSNPAGDDAHPRGSSASGSQGKLREGVTATDLVLQITQMLRKKGVVGKFAVEFYGPGLAHLAVADRTTIGNMSSTRIRLDSGDVLDRRSDPRVTCASRGAARS